MARREQNYVNRNLQTIQPEHPAQSEMGRHHRRGKGNPHHRGGGDPFLFRAREGSSPRISTSILVTGCLSDGKNELLSDDTAIFDSSRSTEACRV